MLHSIGQIRSILESPGRSPREGCHVRARRPHDCRRDGSVTFSAHYEANPPALAGHTTLT